MKKIKRIILLAVCIAVSLVANAQSEQWKGYLDMNNMEDALQRGDTVTFKRLAFRVVRWKGWNPLVFYYTDKYKFLRDCDWWPELDSIQQAIHGRKDYSYAETLYQMEQEDQAARRAFNDPDHTHTKAVEDSLSRRMHEVDSVNLARLIWLVDTLGFPSWDRVCAYGAHAAWLIAQHAHPWFQYGYVKQMRKAVADTNADPSNLAYLEDCLRTGRGLPQLYGTQFSSTGENNRTVWQCPVADIKNVNRRREQMLMPPLEDYIEGYLKTETEQGRLDSDTPLTEMGDNYVRYYYLGDQFSLLPIDKQVGVTDAVAYTATGDYCAAIPIFCSRLSNHYPFVRDLKHYLECLLHSECVGDQYCYISHYEVLERMVLCGYEPDAWLNSLPDTLTVPLLADYANLRDEYLRYLNHEDDAVLSAALASRADFEALLRNGKNQRSATDSGANYHRYELDAWNHAYPMLQKMTDELTKGDYEEFFALLWREVERGNLHAEDYASLYDHTYYRLYGKDWYGTLSAIDKHIRTAKPKTLGERRRAACLPLLSFAVTTSAQTPTYKDYRKYNLNLRIEGDTLRVSGFYLIPYDTTTYSGQPIKVDTAYSLPLADYRTADGAIVLRREGNWYPHRNGELLTAQVHITADDYHIIGGTEWLPSFDIHLVLLPKDKYVCKVIDTPIRPFHFYRLASDTTQYPDAYYNEFVDSYNYYCSFFGDSLSSKPMNIVEIGDPQFVMCQGLRDMIIFGHYFYDVYTMIPDFSWIPHEVAHQWWGDGIFFEYRDYALGESLTEYIKLQFLKSRSRGYEEQIEYYKAMMERAEKTLPIADIHSVESQDESIAIYHAAPYRLTLEVTTSVNTALQQLYHNHKHTIVSREVFLQECKALQDWLKSE